MMTTAEEKRLIESVKSLRSEIEMKLALNFSQANEIQIRLVRSIRESFCKSQPQPGEQNF
ncbi:hypothetical protein LAP67_004465 [Salmonella enterica]|nr:hypothetical protein [Salmonella enterica]